MAGKISAIVIALLSATVTAASGQATDSLAQRIDLTATLVTGTAGAAAALGGYYFAPTVVRAVGLGDTTKDVRAAGAVIATAVLIPLAYRSASGHELSERAMVVSVLLGLAGSALALSANDNDGIQTAVVVGVPLAQLIATLSLQ